MFRSRAGGGKGNLVDVLVSARPLADAGAGGKGGEGGQTGLGQAPKSARFHLAWVSRPPLEELHALATVCVRGAPLPEEVGGGAAPAAARVDRWSPHAFVDAFLANHWVDFRLGRHGDASEALSFVLNDAPGLRPLFQTGCGEEVMLRLPAFVDGADDGDDALSPQDFFLDGDTQRLDVRELLRRGASMDGRLRSKPELLAVHVPQRWERGDGTALFLGGCDILPYWSELPEVVLRAGEEDVAYRLRAYVQYILPEGSDAIPSHVLNDPQGHFVAHFEEDGSWYTADDLGDRPHVVQWAPGTEHKMPFVIFLERVDSRAAGAEACPWPPGPVADSAEGAGGDGDGDADGEDSPDLDGASEEEEEGGVASDAGGLGVRKRPAASASTDAPARKRLRLRGKQSVPERQQSRAGRQQQRQQSRAGRQQSRAGRQQPQSRAGRQQSRAGRQQEDKQRGCKPEELLRQGRKPKSKGDNADGSRQDAQNNAAAPVLRSSMEARCLQAACDARRECGDLFLLLHLLEPLAAADDLLQHYPDFFVYAGDDCAKRWATFLRAPDRPNKLAGRLREALGVTEEEISDGKRRLETGEWRVHHVADLLDERLDTAHHTHSVAAAVRLAVGEGSGAQGDGNPLRAHLVEAWQRRPCNHGPPRHSAMPARLRDRSGWFQCPAPALQYACRMCEAEFPNRETFKAHQSRVHGGQRWYQSQCVARCELEPYQPSPTEERQASGQRASPKKVRSSVWLALLVTFKFGGEGRRGGKGEALMGRWRGTVAL